VDIRESWPRGVELLFQRRIDDLQVSRCAEPRCDREVVVHLERVLVVETEVETLAQESNKSVAELGSCNAHAEAVLRAARHDSLAAAPRRKASLMGFGFPSETPTEKNTPMPCLASSAGCQRLLIEGIVDRPAAALLVRRLDGNDQTRKESREDLLQDRAGIPQPRESILQE
jgi:hypothetical protein